MSFFLRFLSSIIVGVGALYISASILGMIAGELICKFKGQQWIILLVGIVLAESCLLISALSGSSIEFFGNLNDAFPFPLTLENPQLRLWWLVSFQP